MSDWLLKAGIAIFLFIAIGVVLPAAVALIVIDWLGSYISNHYFMIFLWFAGGLAILSLAIIVAYLEIPVLSTVFIINAVVLVVFGIVFVVEEVNKDYDYTINVYERMENWDAPMNILDQ